MKLLCNLNMYTVEQMVYLISDDNSVKPIAAAKISTLPEVIVTTCNTHGIKNVTLAGATLFAQSIVEDIYEFNLKTYNNNDIEVEVI